MKFFSLLFSLLFLFSVSFAANPINRVTPQNLIPVGAVQAFALQACPDGWLAADGGTISRTTYSALFSAMGTIHGTGNGTITFHLPDYRGRFLRGHDGGVARDPDASGRTAMNTGGNTGDNVGSVQGHAFQTHNHGVTDPTHKHSTNNTNQSGTAGGVHTSGTNVSGPQNASSAYDTDFSATGITIQTAGATGAFAQATTSETRPANATVLYCIKY
jgi:microcystin-dependent protein